jgi:hypothetical protein
MVGAHVGVRTRDHDVDSVVCEEVVKRGVFLGVNAVAAQQARSRARRPVIDAGNAGLRMVAEDFDILSGHPACADQADAILFLICDHKPSCILCRTKN